MIFIWVKLCGERQTLFNYEIYAWILKLLIDWILNVNLHFYVDLGALNLLHVSVKYYVRLVYMCIVLSQVLNGNDVFTSKVIVIGKFYLQLSLYLVLSTYQLLYRLPTTNYFLKIIHFCSTTSPLILPNILILRILFLLVMFSICIKL